MNTNRFIAVTMLVVTLSAPLFSFAPRFGGEGFVVYINNKPVIQRFGNEMSIVKTISLSQYSPGDQLTIKYYHCGRIGKSRTITIKDVQKKILKQWKYEDVADPVAGMNCFLKDFIGLEKNSTVLYLYYSSTELPEGRLLASFSAGKNAATQPAP